MDRAQHKTQDEMDRAQRKMQYRMNVAKLRMDRAMVRAQRRMDRAQHKMDRAQHKMDRAQQVVTHGQQIVARHASYRYDCSSPIVEQTPSAGESIFRCGDIRATCSTGDGSFVSIGGTGLRQRRNTASFRCDSPIVVQTPSTGDSFVRGGNIRDTGGTGSGLGGSVGGTEIGQTRNTGQSGGEGIKRKIEEVSEVYNVASVSNDVAEVRNEGAKHKKRPRLSQNIEVVQQLKEQNNQLRERTMCKICMEKEVAVVFLPCRHFVSCTDCAAGLKDCPVCRNVVRRRVRAFMA